MTEELSATTLPTPGLLVQDQRLHQLLSSRSRASGLRALVHFAGVAQSVEHLFCKQVVRGSSPLASSMAHRSRDPYKEGLSPDRIWRRPEISTNCLVSLRFRCSRTQVRSAPVLARHGAFGRAFGAGNP